MSCSLPLRIVFIAAERYRSLAPMYYRGAAAAVVVFDVTNRDSFEGAKSWVKELQRRGDPSVVIALAGNKADIKDGRVVDVSVRAPVRLSVCPADLRPICPLKSAAGELAARLTTGVPLHLAACLLALCLPGMTLGTDSRD